MKKIFIRILSFVLAITVFAFNSKQTPKVNPSFKYLIFTPNLTPAEYDINNYQQTSIQPNFCQGNVKLCWIFVDDLNNDGVIDQNELDYFMWLFDTNADGNLSNEAESNFIEKKL